MRIGNSSHDVVSNDIVLLALQAGNPTLIAACARIHDKVLHSIRLIFDFHMLAVPLPILTLDRIGAIDSSRAARADDTIGKFAANAVEQSRRVPD